MSQVVGGLSYDGVELERSLYVGEEKPVLLSALEEYCLFANYSAH